MHTNAIRYTFTSVEGELGVFRYANANISQTGHWNAVGRGDSRDGSWAKTILKILQKSLQRRRSTPSGDGFIDSVFTAIMQISSTIIPKYIESGLGHHPKERLSEFPNIGIL